MNAEQTKDYLSGLPMAEALWWFIENVNEDSAHRSELFFYLRERMRSHDPKADYQFAKQIGSQA